MIKIYFDSFEKAAEKTSKKSQEELKDTLKANEMQLIDVLRRNGLSDNRQLLQVLVSCVGGSSRIACLGCVSAQKKSAVKIILDNDFLPFADVADQDPDSFFAVPDGQVDALLSHLAENFEGAFPTLGEMMLSIAYAGGESSAEALDRIKAFYQSHAVQVDRSESAQE